MPSKPKTENRYSAIIERIFHTHYAPGKSAFDFERVEFEGVAKKLRIMLPKNLGDIIYSFRYRVPLPASILALAPKGSEWIIKSAGRSKYRFQLTKVSKITPRRELVATKIPDATPEVVTTYAQGDEQALLAKLRYNRLIDLFLGLTTYSLQNHLRTSVSGVGQIEIDELYVGIDKFGAHHVIPVQAKAGKDRISVVQTAQDIDCCKQKFSSLRCRAISAQFMDNDRIALFELAMVDDEIRIIDERHYVLVPSESISDAELAEYRSRSSG